MKKTLKSLICLMLLLVLATALFSCSEKVEKTGLWENATYLKDTELGKGATTVLIEVKAGEQSITFTVNTDKETLGDALIELELISGDEGPYGLYVKSVNGIVADYDVDQSWWALYKDGEMLLTGVDSTKISSGEYYELVYSN